MRKKLILFDWGNIVESHTTGYSCKDAFDDLFRECGYTGQERVFNVLGKYNLTKIETINEFEKVYGVIAKDFNLNKSVNEFIELYKKIFNKIDYYKEVAKYEVSLKDKCFIGILSNLIIFDKERIDKQVNLDKYDYVFLSFEMGLKKPDIEIYKKIQSMVPFKPSDILFIDDRTNNIETANKMGWNTLQATGLELDKIKEKCEEFINSK